MAYDPSTKQKIYEAAKKLFIQEGFGVSSRKIACQAGVNLGLITYYFKTKNNIALMIMKETYEIIGAHLKYVIDPGEDLLLYLITYLNICYRAHHSENGQLFFTQMFEEDLIEESIYTGNNQTALYRKLVDTYMGGNGSSPEKNFSIFQSVLQGTVRNLFRRSQVLPEITYDDLFIYTIRAFFWGLGLACTDAAVNDLKERSDKAAEAVIRKYPHLLDPGIFLFQEDPLKNGPDS
ncbi:TetR/AcrR family transcriptional regulator [Eubacterium sp. 1001713B170207_170306_E7]|uniref:TetR/AcrR family transcriptional regulator n=1 Tax=Eubacterium sp. 1001713B170207_170306_E7 TaxID=2787097 RepID=UPI001899EE72|nr:TetR/AcrR family transcriptional regulator [Eubacterium sp. 1001713B170207_170306_E7]